ncbi:hypothetical protein TNCV_24981 [Trichonephila clavipes]|uniref:Uncharacterized protein n=1 Tax=Trichonephila clavipes TaxID=2585209 RepID=A0A8X6W134_TRICX|nr:hypothetical protein TNCV_24981 [Trichonephila clavipes]
MHQRSSVGDVDDLSLLVVTSQISGQALYLGGAGPTRTTVTTYEGHCHSNNAVGDGVVLVVVNGIKGPRPKHPRRNSTSTELNCRHNAFWLETFSRQTPY